jgi:hypothetical protein
MCRSRAFAMLVKSWIQWILEIVFSRMGRCLWNHGFAKFGVFFEIVIVCVFPDFMHLCFLWNRYVCIFAKLRSCELMNITNTQPCYFSEVIKSTLLWICEIVICMNVANARICYFRKSKFLIFVIYRNCCFHDGCGLAHLLFLWIHGFYCLWIFDITIYLKS